MNYIERWAPELGIKDQDPNAGISVPAGTNMNFWISLGPEPTISFSYTVQTVFNTFCLGCHSFGGFAGFYPLSGGVSHNNLVNNPATRTGTPPSGILVVPYDSANSVLYQRISDSGLPANESRMPLVGSPLGFRAQGYIQTWIDEGAHNN